ncbi:hypothetical protein CH381_31570 [Leptospira sp. mixed culture ATI2-C-A1]|nr:hypothetical protein CH381_31570 [Leptospira sp. mixed culture ATI2-C-A1]
MNQKPNSKKIKSNCELSRVVKVKTRISPMEFQTMLLCLKYRMGFYKRVGRCIELNSKKLI